MEEVKKRYKIKVKTETEKKKQDEIVGGHIK